MNEGKTKPEMIAANLQRNVRKFRGLTQKQMAEEVGKQLGMNVAYQEISKVINSYGLDDLRSEQSRLIKGMKEQQQNGVTTAGVAESIVDLLQDRPKSILTQLAELQESNTSLKASNEKLEREVAQMRELLGLETT
jgi:transcriptional regulator with XRE-family HTH domain